MQEREILQLFSEYMQLSLTIAFVVVHFIGQALTSHMVRRFGQRKSLDNTRIVYTNKFFAFLWFIVTGTFLALTWDISFSGLSIYFASFFTVAGVAFFASWSILSNVTASVVLFFNFPYKIGSSVKVIDGDNSVKGIIRDISLFSVKIEVSDNNFVSYPNNLLIQKPVILLTEDEPVP